MFKPDDVVFELDFRQETFEERARRMKAADLRLFLKERGLSTGGSRDTLLERCILNKDMPKLPARQLELCGLRVDTLKEILREYGLRIGGSKQALVDRIMEHEEEPLAAEDEGGHEEAVLQDDDIFENDLLAD